MRVLSMGLVATLLLIGHVQASGGHGRSMPNPYHKKAMTAIKEASKKDLIAKKKARKTVPDLIAKFDGPSKNLKQALYKVKYNGKYLTKIDRDLYYYSLSNNRDFSAMIRFMGIDEALKLTITVHERYPQITINQAVEAAYSVMLRNIN